MYSTLADIIKYALVVIVYLFIYSVVKLVYLDISDSKKQSGDGREHFGYLKLINLRSDLNCKIFESYPLYESNIIGRSRKCDIQINNPHLSKIHAEIYMDNDKFFIIDLDSTNGTFVNKVKIGEEPIRLKNNDHIIFGDIRFIFISEV